MLTDERDKDRKGRGKPLFIDSVWADSRRMDCRLNVSLQQPSTLRICTVLADGEIMVSQERLDGQTRILTSMVLVEVQPSSFSTVSYARSE